MRSRELPPTEKLAYKLGQFFDPGTPGDKREIYDQAKRNVTAAGILSPPVGLGLGVLDLEHAAHKYKEGEGSLTDVALAAPGALPGAAGKLPRLRGGYHATSSPENFSTFIKSERDMGTHISTDPNVARGYAMGDYSPNKFKRDWEVSKGDINASGPRTIPVVADIRNPLKYPGDPVNWQKPSNVLRTLESNATLGTANEASQYGKLMTDLEKVSGKPGDWEGNFYNYLKDRKHDAVQYPHITGSVKPTGFNSFMALDPEQVVPKFSPEGQALIKERGVIKPSVTLNWNPMDQAFWDMKHGLLKSQDIIGNPKYKGLLSGETKTAEEVAKEMNISLKSAQSVVDKDVLQKLKWASIEKSLPDTHYEAQEMANTWHKAIANEMNPKTMNYFNEGASWSGIPKEDLPYVVQELAYTGNGELLNKTLKDMSASEYKKFSKAVTNANNMEFPPGHPDLSTDHLESFYK
jgi:hypothetical protein